MLGCGEFGWVVALLAVQSVEVARQGFRSFAAAVLHLSYCARAAGLRADGGIFPHWEST